MREVMLIFLFLGIKGSKLDKEEAPKFAINTLSMGTMGHIGLAQLIVSGGYLMTPYWRILPAKPVLIAKLALVLILTIRGGQA